MQKITNDQKKIAEEDCNGVQRLQNILKDY